MSKSKKPNQQVKFSLILAGVFMLFLVFNMMSTKKEDEQVLEFSDFIAKVEAGDVSKVTFKQEELVVNTSDSSAFRVYITNPDPELREQLIAKGVRVSYEPAEEESVWKALLLNSLPLLLLLFLFFFFMRQLQVGGGKAMSFGKSRAKLLNENQTKLTFKDVAGVEEAKSELEEIVDFLKDPKKFTKLGGRIPKGVLLVGPPGTGKTILAKAISGEAGVPFFSISGSDFVEMFVGVGASRVRDLFEQAKKQAPCIIFIDEIDAVGRQRGAGLGGGHDEREQTLNQLLVEMDGFETNEGVILIAATNRADVLDPALLRPGRFDRRVYVPKPDVRGRRGILGVHTRKTPMEDDVDLDILAQGTSGFSGADLENLVNEAALIAARNDFKKVNMGHFESAKDKVLMGPERKSMMISEDEKRNTAYHEAGHCIVAKMVPGTDPVHKITIIPRGQALGVTILLPTEDRLSMSKSFAEGIIAYAMGGRAAEEIVFGHTTTGAGNDLQKATDIARKMVCNWGMSEKLGPISIGSQEHEVFLGREWGNGPTYSQEILADIDSEVKRFLTEGYDKALTILRENRTILNEMSESLLVRETLESKDIDALMRGEIIVTEEEKAEYRERIEREKKARDIESKASGKATSDSSESEGDEPKQNPVNPVPQGT